MKKKTRKKDRKSKPMPKKYNITIDDDDEIFTVASKKMELLKAIPIGKKTISSRVGKALGLKTRRALFYLDQLEDDGYLESTWDVVQHKKSNARTRARVFTRIK